MEFVRVEKTMSQQHIGYEPVEAKRVDVPDAKPKKGFDKGGEREFVGKIVADEKEQSVNGSYKEHHQRDHPAKIVVAKTKSDPVKPEKSYEKAAPESLFGIECKELIESGYDQEGIEPRKVDAKVDEVDGSAERQGGQKGFY